MGLLFRGNTFQIKSGFAKLHLFVHNYIQTSKENLSFASVFNITIHSVSVMPTRDNKGTADVHFFI